MALDELWVFSIELVDGDFEFEALLYSTDTEALGLAPYLSLNEYCAVSRTVSSPS